MENLVIIRDQDELLGLYKDLEASDFLAYDTETNGVEKDSLVIGFSVSDRVDTGYYVILHEWDGERLIPVVPKEAVLPILELLSKKNLIMHNAIFDCQMTINNFGIDLLPAVHTDTMILGHLLDENRSNGLKELGTSIFGEDARKEQTEMKENVLTKGGRMDKTCYELYKADSHLIAKYGAKDAILTLRLFYHFVPQLYEQKLDKFFYEEECMPLFKGPTYDLNTTGLLVDAKALQKLKLELEFDCMEAKAFIMKEIEPHIKDKYPGTKAANTFNIGSNEQRVWLLFFQLDNDFHLLTKAGKELCKAMGWRLPYTRAAKREFIENCKHYQGHCYKAEGFNWKTKKKESAKIIKDPVKYISCGKETLNKFSDQYKWVKKLLEYSKNLKLLNTYVIGIQEKMKYNIIRPSFLQHGTTSGRYSSKKPNFQNLPRDDKRVKKCIISRPGKVFVGGDESQLEPRVFASISGDKRLLEGFKSAADFYSVIGMEIFSKTDCKPLKEGDSQAFGILYPELRDISKKVPLSATYGTTAPKMAPLIGKSIEEAQQVIDDYFNNFPDVLKFMLESHAQAKTDGVVYNLYGRPRRMKKATQIPKLFGKNTPHKDIPYEYRNLLNLAVNHRVQSSGASIVNRSAIRLYREIRALDPEARIVMQCHDSLVVECNIEFADSIASILQDCMENTVTLPGVALEAKPRIGKTLADV